ncbi:hypothetical protein D9M73_251120 [compost metagenome]
MERRQDVGEHRREAERAGEPDCTGRLGLDGGNLGFRHSDAIEQALAMFVEDAADLGDAELARRALQ